MNTFLKHFILFVVINSINCGIVKNHRPTKINEKQMHSNGIFENDRKNNEKLIDGEEDNAEYWLNKAKEFVTQKTEQFEKLNNKTAKNVIFFLGDGMSIATLAAARVYLGGEELPLSFERFPAVGMVKTYCLNEQVSDSGCTATAYLNGIKGNVDTIGVNGKVKFNDCDTLLDVATHTQSLAKLAMDAGKVAGLVTTTRVTHASPAGVYAHTSNRDWETDYYVKDDQCNPDVINDIAEQLIMGDGRNLRVILGGGRRSFLNESVADQQGYFGYRTDGKNLIQDWENDKILPTDRKSYIWNRQSLNSLNVDSVDYLLGLFANSHLRYNIDNLKETIENREPSLKEMTEKAIDVLNKHDSGYFLFVEGGLIDYGHHASIAHYALDETREFSLAIEAAIGKVNLDETLIIVTADHSHTMSISGYPNRGHDIFGLAGISSSDNLPLMTLNYANGPGYNGHFDSNFGRVNLTGMLPTPQDYVFPAMVYNDLETHAGDDVAIFAIGPWSHLFTGIFEQSNIPQLIGYAACIGDGRKSC